MVTVAFRGEDQALRLQGSAKKKRQIPHCARDERRGQMRLSSSSSSPVFLIDGADFAFFVEDRVEHFVFADDDVAELRFLREGYGLQLHHF